jgi:Carboxypeptidase regulatory-like domain
VAFRVVGRDGAGVPGAGVTLLDDRGGEAAGAVTGADGRGTVLAPHPGSYVLVSAAVGHQPGAVAITVAGEPVSADLLLARSASLSGVVHGEDGPVVGARLTLVQDGEIVDTAESGPGGAYRIADLAAGEYGLSVTASECEPAAVLVTVPDETDLQHDVELDPVGLNRPADDVMIGLS